mmetsp:Transcript_4940/g.7965  ORF Transcript_4940/g.7965 Transcript_4940/m.7965 type:complete len:132 (+) Transcript_4940:43-438(+)
MAESLEKNLTCKRCKLKIEEDLTKEGDYAITAFGGHYHKKCFACGDCNERLFSISKFFEKNGGPVCGPCHNRKGPKCAGCGVEIAEVDHVESNGLHFCKKECMKCGGCKKVVKEGDFFEDEGKLWHLECAS